MLVAGIVMVAVKQSCKRLIRGNSVDKVATGVLRKTFTLRTTEVTRAINIDNQIN